MKELLKFETDRQFIGLCIGLIVFGIITNGIIVAPSIIHKAQIPTYTGEWF